MDSYEVKLKFHVVSFASEAKDIVDITETEISGSADDVIWNLMKFDYHSRIMLVSPAFTHRTPKKILLVIRFEVPAFQGFACPVSAGHGRKTGTNLHAALHRVNEVIGYFKENSAEYNFNETQNIIIIATDGKDTVKFQPGCKMLDMP